MIVIEGKMPDLNDYISALNASRYKGARLKAQWTDRVRDEAVRAREPRRRGPVRLYLRCHEPRHSKRNKPRDVDNIVAFAAKVAMDGLVRAGVIGDDNREWAPLPPRCDVIWDSDEPRVEIQLRELGGRRRRHE